MMKPPSLIPKEGGESCGGYTNGVAGRFELPTKGLRGSLMKAENP